MKLLARWCKPVSRASAVLTYLLVGVLTMRKRIHSSSVHILSVLFKIKLYPIEKKPDNYLTSYKQYKINLKIALFLTLIHTQ